MVFDTLPIETARTFDENGYLHVKTSNITKEQVVPYIGDTIPGWEELGLKPKAIYQIYRPADEIEKAADTFNGLPLSLDHWNMDANNMPKDKIVGSLGTDAAFDAPYLTNSLTVTDADAIERIKSGEFRDLSAGYLCDVEMINGIFNGKAYDGIMRNIRGNHVALVREGRAGHDVRVADSAPKGGEIMDNWKKLFMDLVETIKNGGEMPMEKEEIKKEEIVEESAPDMTNTAPAVENAPEVAETKDEEPVDVLADEIREAMTAAGLDPEDKAAQKAFLAGIAYAKPVEDEAAEEAEDKCKDTATDSAPVFDKATAAALYTAAEEVAPYVGKISNPFAFDSAADIYKKALDAKEIPTEGVDPSAFGAMVGMLKKTVAQDSAPVVEDDKVNDVLRAIKAR